MLHIFTGIEIYKTNITYDYLKYIRYMRYCQYIRNKQGMINTGMGQRKYKTLH